jgi:hypothetical protein
MYHELRDLVAASPDGKTSEGTVAISTDNGSIMLTTHTYDWVGAVRLSVHQARGLATLLEEAAMEVSTERYFGTANV